MGCQSIYRLFAGGFGAVRYRLIDLLGSAMSETFIPAVDFRMTDTDAQRIVAFHRDRLVIQTTPDGPCIPSAVSLRSAGLTADTRLRLGTIGSDIHCGWSLTNPPTLPEGLALEGLRALFGQLGEADFQIAGYAMQILRWVSENRYCGLCGDGMTLESGDRALICAGCGNTQYPRISPAIIVAVTSNRRLLLARSGRFPNQRMYSVIAGYVEPGETLEECVRREVREEVGLEVRRIRYFGSQSWPFSASLMVGFTAEHAGGRIAVDGQEILEADWFPADRLPEIPMKVSISRKLIDWFVENH